MAKLKVPLLLINFKAYESSSGKNAVNLANICEKVAKETGASIAVAVQAADIHAVSRAVSIPVLAQHIDNIECGANTGKVLARAVKENGAAGTLLNHSEKRVPLDELKESIAKAKSAGLAVVACAKDDTEGKEISSFRPDFVAVEPPELIGGDISVSTARPGLISDSVEKIGKNVLVGAGVKTTEDVRVSISLGAAGVLVASGVTKAKDPEKEIRALVEGLKG